MAGILVLLQLEEDLLKPRHQLLQYLHQLQGSIQSRALLQTLLQLPTDLRDLLLYFGHVLVEGFDFFGQVLRYCDARSGGLRR